MLLTKDNPEHDVHRQSFRKYAQEQGTTSERVKYAYMYEETQSHFVKDLTRGKGVLNHTSGTLKVSVDVAYY